MFLCLLVSQPFFTVAQCLDSNLNMFNATITSIANHGLTKFNQICWFSSI